MIVSKHDPGARHEIVFAQELLGVQPLEGLIVGSADGVAVGEHRVAVAVDFRIEHRGLAQATGAQQQSAAGNFRIFFLATEPSQERHALKEPGCETR